MTREASNPAAGDQQLQPLRPLAETDLVPNQDYRISTVGDSIYDPASVGLEPGPTTKSFKVLAGLECGASPDEEAGGTVRAGGVRMFVVELTNPGGTTQIGLMPYTVSPNEGGKVAATGAWAQIPDRDAELTLGRGKAKALEAGTATLDQIWVEDLFTTGIQGGEFTQSVSRSHLAVKFDSTRKEVTIRDLGSTFGTRLTAPAEGSDDAESGLDADTVPRAAGKLAASSFIAEVPEHLLPTEAEVEPVSPPEPAEQQRNQLRGQIADLTANIQDDPHLSDVERIRTTMWDIDEDIQDIYRDTRKPVSQRQYDNPNGMLGPLKERKGAYQRDLMDLDRRGIVARFDAHPLVQQRQRLYEQLAALK